MTIQNNTLGAEQVHSLVMEYGLNDMRQLCQGVRERFNYAPALNGIFHEMQTHESQLADGTSACLLAASMHSFLTNRLNVDRALGYSRDEQMDSSLGELRAALSANVVAEYERGNTDPEYRVTLARDLVYVRAVAEQPFEAAVGAGASLLLALHAQSRSLS